MLVFGLNTSTKKKRKFNLSCIFDEYSKSDALASLNLSMGPVYNNLAYHGGPPLSLLRTNTTQVGTRAKLYQS